jgi:hypothetical protein
MMARFGSSVVVNRPSGEVFAFLADPLNDPHWSAACLEMRRVSGGPVNVGSTFQQVSRFMRRRFELTLEVTAYEPDRRFGMKVITGPLKFAGMRLLETVPDGTRVTFMGGGQSGGFFQIAEPLLALAARRQLTKDLIALKRVLETRGSSDLSAAQAETARR